MRLVRLTALLTAILLVVGFSTSISAAGANPVPQAAPMQCGVTGTPDCPPNNGPAIAISKTASPPSLPAGGGSVTYTYTVTNAGNLTLSGVTVTDDHCAPVTFVSGDTNGNTLLESTEIWIFKCTTNVTVTTTNKATVTGVSTTGLTVVAVAVFTVNVEGCPPTAPNCPTPTPCPPGTVPPNCGPPPTCPPGTTNPNCPTPTPCPPTSAGPNCPPATAKLCVTKFNDLDGNGSKGPGEPVLAGVTFSIAPVALAVPPGPQVTPATGQVCWAVPAGVYTITESGPLTIGAWVPTTPIVSPSKSQTIAIAAGGSINRLFGDHKFLIDHFECYTISPTNLTNQFVGIGVKDQFASRTVLATKRVDLCNPVQKSFQGVAVKITNPAAHLLCYQAAIRQPVPVPGSITATVRVTNQFGNRTLQVLAPTQLCLPTGKSVATTFPAIPNRLDHFMCYAVKDVTGGATNPVVLTDQFGTRTAGVARPVSLCTPTRKTYQGKTTGVLDAKDHLVCYSIDTSTMTAKSVLIANQFERVPLRVIKPFLLCVPSLKRVSTFTP